MARRILGWSSGGSSPTSSRKSVPPCARRKSPSESRRASVNAPWTCPKSSDSKRFLGMAAQFTATKFPCLPPAWCAALAKSSLPVPLSPKRRRPALEGAASWSMVKASCIAGLRPRMGLGGGLKEDSGVEAARRAEEDARSSDEDVSGVGGVSNVVTRGLLASGLAGTVPNHLTRRRAR